MKEHFRKVFDYDHWATLRIVHALENMPAPPVRSLELLDHLIFAKACLLDVIRFGDCADPPDHLVPSLAESSQAEQQAHADWISYLTDVSEQDLHRALHLAGEDGGLDCIVADVCHHALNHATHHRAQIGTILRTLDIEPPGLDYTSFCWTEPANG